MRQCIGLHFRLGFSKQGDIKCEVSGVGAIKPYNMSCKIPLVANILFSLKLFKLFKIKKC